MGKLTAADRNNLPRGAFALPGKGSGKNGKGHGSFPIPDASHARNALARASGKGPEVEAKVRAKVHEKFPGIGGKRGPKAEHHFAHGRPWSEE